MVQFAWPGLFAVSRTYSALAAIAPEWAWAVLAGSIVIIGVAGVVMRVPRLTEIVLILSVAWWIALGTVLLVATPHGLGWGFAFAWAVVIGCEYDRYPWANK